MLLVLSASPRRTEGLCCSLVYGPHDELAVILNEQVSQRLLVNSTRVHEQAAIVQFINPQQPCRVELA